MLTTEAVQSAIPLAQDFLSRGLSLIPVENTPLAALTKESMPTHNPNINDSEYAIGNAGFDIEFTANSKQPGTDIIPHDMILDEIVPTVADTVRRSVSHARTVVVPLVEDLVSRVKTAVEQLNPSSLLGVEVIVFNPPKPLINGVFENSIAKYSDTNYDASLALPFALPELNEEDLRKLVGTGANELEKDIDEWLANKGEGFLHSVWFDFFMLQKASNLHSFITQPENKSSFGRSNADIDRLLAVHLIARNLFDNPPEGTNASLAVFNDIVAAVRNASGARLYFENQDYYDEVGKRKILVRSIAGNKVIVNGEVYKNWIAEGGENEILFGNSLVKLPSRDIDSVTARKEELLKEWNRHCAVVSTAESTRKFVRVKEIFFTAFRNQLIEDQDAELNREVLLRNFQEQLQHIRESDLECFYSLSLRLICRARFPQTDAEEILTSINRIAKENPKLEVREAAAVAVIEYIANWIAQQLKVV